VIPRWINDQGENSFEGECPSTLPFKEVKRRAIPLYLSQLKLLRRGSGENFSFCGRESLNPPLQRG
jgi:hypothetical protein